MPRAAASSVEEPKRRVGSPMPPGYVFVPKGNVYVTSHCRRRTREAHRTVYSVVGAAAPGKQPPPLGILVPREVAQAVHAAEAATRADRARAVARHDAGLERRFREVVAREFPGAPPSDMGLIVARAMRKGSRRVGRTAALDVDVRARLAVRAHIRHQHTDYDDLLRRRVSKPQARRSTLARIEEVVRAWGGQALPPKKQGKTKKRAQGKKNTKDARKPDGPKKGSAVQAKKAPAIGKPGNSPVRTQKQVTRTADRRQKKQRTRQARQVQTNAAATPAASTQAPSVVPAASSTWVTPNTWNWAASDTWATPTASPATWVTNSTWNWAPPASGTAAAPICIDDDETDEGDESDESDEYAWRGTDDELDSDEMGDEDDCDSEMEEDEYRYESDTAADDNDSDISWHL